MLIKFEISNFRSIKENQSISMLPAKKIRERVSELLFAEEGLYTLSFASVFGANNAGKSNIIKALYALKWFVLNSQNLNYDDKIDVSDAYQLDINKREDASTFELEFIAPDNVRYIYLVSFDQNIIYQEKLMFYPKNKSGIQTISKLYDRKHGKPISFGESLKGKKKNIETDLNPNQFFLSKAANNNHAQLIPVYLFFKNKLAIHNFENTFGNDDFNKIQFTNLGKFIAENKDSLTVKLIESIVTNFDTGIRRISVSDDSETPSLHFPENYPKKKKTEILNEFVEQFKYQIKTIYPLFDGEEEIGETEIALNEQSTGTQKLFVLSRFIIDALLNGEVLIIDELDKSLHPELTINIIDLFRDKRINKKNAQLIFATHDATLINNDIFSRDQIWFVEKNKFGATEIFALSDFEKPRTNSLEKWYLSGRFGAKPQISKTDIYKKLLNEE